MSNARALQRQQRRIEDLCAAAIRAVSGQPELRLRAGRLYRGPARLPRYAAHLYPVFGQADAISFRGAADGLALRASRSDALLHAHFYPDDPIERLVFDLLEQFRVESLAPPLPGLRRNLAHRFVSWSEEFVASGLTETELGMLLFSAAQICRVHVAGDPLPERTSDLIETARGALIGTIGADLRSLRRHRPDQAAYARPALSLAAAVSRLAHVATANAKRAARDDAEDAARALALLIDDTKGGDDAGLPVAVSVRGAAPADAEGSYRAFTTVWDRECAASELVRRPLLAEYRLQLDGSVAHSGIHFNRLARDLRTLLAQLRPDDWEGGQEHGRIDGRRLAQLAASPAERRLFRVEQFEPHADCQLTLLIDCSGSMRRHTEAIATFADILSRALDMAGVPHEILGFTTGTWNGGRARRDWLRAGRPRAPGRLNEAQHIVFKPYEQSWRQSRARIAALLCPELYREGIDGEAVDWACKRLLARAHARRLLLVISDGCPMDAATQLANDPGYLDRHLCEVVAHHEQRGHAEIYGIGVGLDLGIFYPRNLVVDLAAIRGNGALRDILGLLARNGRR